MSQMCITESFHFPCIIEVLRHHLGPFSFGYQFAELTLVSIVHCIDQSPKSSISKADQAAKNINTIIPSAQHTARQVENIMVQGRQGIEQNVNAMNQAAGAMNQTAAVLLQNDQKIRDLTIQIEELNKKLSTALEKIASQEELIAKNQQLKKQLDESLEAGDHLQKAVAKLEEKIADLEREKKLDVEQIRLLKQEIIRLNLALAG